MRRIIGLLTVVGLMGLSFYPFPNKKVENFIRMGKGMVFGKRAEEGVGYDGRKKVFMGKKL